jgi:hypothetical protein
MLSDILYWLVSSVFYIIMRFFADFLVQWFPRRRVSMGVLLLLAIASFWFGTGAVRAIAPSSSPPSPAQPAQTTLLAQSTAVSPTNPTDAVPQRFQQGQALYLQNCASCHIALPPAAMPSQTWRDLIQDPQHYGTQITPLVDPYRLALWQYLQVYSRPVKKDEPVPYRLSQSRPFKALHPRVKMPVPLGAASCAACHPAAAQFDFRSLTAEWQDAP